MLHSRKFLSLLFLFNMACGHKESASTDSKLATLAITGLSEMNASQALLTVRSENGPEKSFKLLGPDYKVSEAFSPGSYTFSLELFGDSGQNLIASTKVEPCRDVKTTLNSGANVLSIPVCNVKGIILNPSEKADLEIKITAIDRPLYRDYALSCKNSQGSFSNARAQASQSLSSTLSSKPMGFSETKVESGIHTLTLNSSEGSAEVRSVIDTATSTLKIVTFFYQPISGTTQELRFAGWECEALPYSPTAEIPGGFPSWDAINELDPEKHAAAIYDGIDPVAESFGDDARCSIYIMASYLEDGTTPTHLLRSSFAHNGHSHPFVKIKENSPQSMSLSGKSASGQDEIKLNLKQAGITSSMSAARIRWLHDDHFHNDTCERLVRRGS